MKIAIYSPYLHILGGGEKYLLDIAVNLSKKNEVFLFTNPNVQKEIMRILGINLEGIKFIGDNLFHKSNNPVSRIQALHDFDELIFMTDGSVPYPINRKNYMIIQSPIHIPKKNLRNSLKLKKWKIVCYSGFMQKIIAGKLKKNAYILSPAVDIRKYKNNSIKKENIILSVGRFFAYPHNKKHDVLIEAFKSNFNYIFTDWKLIIAGGVTEESGEEIFNKLKILSEQFPIEIYKNLPFEKLVNLYNRAKIYWHAAGYGEDIINHPERAEHFGITPLEALASGCIPLVYNGGGLPDTIHDGRNGFLWNTITELISKTSRLIDDEMYYKNISDKLAKEAESFSLDKFYANLQKIFT